MMFLNNLKKIHDIRDKIILFSLENPSDYKDQVGHLKWERFVDKPSMSWVYT